MARFFLISFITLNFNWFHFEKRKTLSVVNADGFVRPFNYGQSLPFYQPIAGNVDFSSSQEFTIATDRAFVHCFQCKMIFGAWVDGWFIHSFAVCVCDKIMADQMAKVKNLSGCIMWAQLVWSERSHFAAWIKISIASDRTRCHMQCTWAMCIGD